MSDRLCQGGLDPLKGIDGGMVERIARAIHADERKLSATDPGCGPSFDDDTEFHRHVCRKCARAVIKVMAEPTEAMIDAHKPWLSRQITTIRYALADRLTSFASFVGGYGVRGDW